MTQATTINSFDTCVARAIVQTVSKIKKEEKQWLWPGWIPEGAITIVEGPPGISKSLLTIDLGARVSRGDAMPLDVKANAERRDVLFMAAEDDAAQTIKPRLKAAGARTRRVHVLSEIEDTTGRRMPRLPEDVDFIRAVLIDKSVRLLIIDPLTAYVGPSCSLSSDQSVRRMLKPLVSLAEELGIAVLILRHLTKKSGSSAINSGSGSIALAGVARSVLRLGAHPEDGDVRVLASAKSNLGPAPMSLAYRVIQRAQGPRLEWLEPVDLSAEDLRVGGKGASGTGCSSGGELQRAIEFLTEELAEGPVAYNRLLQVAHQNAISKKTLTRARTELGVKASKKGFGASGGWSLSLPVAESSSAEDEDADEDEDEDESEE